jgi:hypothetical protein
MEMASSVEDRVNGADTDFSRSGGIDGEVGVLFHGTAEV